MGAMTKFAESNNLSMLFAMLKAEARKDGVDAKAILILSRDNQGLTPSIEQVGEFFRGAPDSVAASLRSLPLFVTQGVDSEGFVSQGESIVTLSSSLSTVYVRPLITRKTVMPAVMEFFKAHSGG